MAKISCFCALLGGNRKKSKDVRKVSYAKRANANGWQKVKPVECMDGTNAAPIVCKGSADSAPARDSKVVAETAGDKASPTSVVPNIDLVGGTASTTTDSSGCGSDKDAISAPALEDVTMSAAAGRALPNTPSRLQRSCSNIETTRSGWKAFHDMLPAAKSRSHDDLVALPAGSLFTSPNVNGEAGGASPAPSVKTTCSADRVMLRRRSSSQVLPSRSRKLWWSLFLWSHRNLHRPCTATSVLRLPPSGADHDVRHSLQKQDGYTSDTLGAKKNKEIAAAEEETAVPSQWVAFSAEASSG